LIRKTIEYKKNKRTQFYSVYSIKETAEIRDRVEDKHTCFYRKTANTTSIESRTFLYVGISVLPAIKVVAPEGQSGVLTRQVFDLSSFLSFTAWYKTKYNIKLGTDPAELTKLITIFKTIQDALSL
jgi:hypothetical protein